MDPTEEPPDIAAVFDQLRTTRGRVPTLYRVLAHRPEILSAHRAYFHAALDTGLLSRQFKEKVAFRVALVCGSEYSQASHRRYAVQHGVEEAELQAIEVSDYEAVDATTRLALRLVDVTVGGEVEGLTYIWNELAANLTPPELVELASLIGVMQLASTLGLIFDLRPDGEI
jgi:AhpD family alkylhydroperoxidase